MVRKILIEPIIILRYFKRIRKNQEILIFDLSLQLANANNTLTIANSFAAVINKEVENESHLKGRLLPQLGGLKDEYAKVAAFWYVSLQSKCT